MNARAQAAVNLAGVVEKGKSLSAILDAPANKEHPDTGFIRELSFGVLRHYFSLREHPCRDWPDRITANTKRD